MRTTIDSSLRALLVAALVGTAAWPLGAQTPARRRAAPARPAPAAAPAPAPTAAAPKVTSPEEFFGHRIGADYVLPNYQKLTAYWKRLDAESDRMTLGNIGKTAEGRDQLMAIVTSPENHVRLARYKEIAGRLAKAEGLTAEQARALAQEGKAVVWIDGGLHATEVLGAQQLMETLYQFVSMDDPETTRILNDVVILFVHANPDGHDLVADWYMRNPEPTKRSTSNIPRLYQKYIGHDNNRDFYLGAQPETQNILRIQYHEWFPQIVYNHHQTGPAGAVMFAPPFRDPFNYFIDPMVIMGIDQVGSAMQSRFVAEDKPGVVMRRGANYSTWWNGGLRTMVYFHNMIGLLTESIGNPTPITVPFVFSKQLPGGDTPLPLEPQRWHFRTAIEYSVTANRAVLDFASRYRETLLLRIYEAGKNSIERGSRDHWTVTPSKLDALRAATEKQGARTPEGEAAVSVPGGLFRQTPSFEASVQLNQALRSPASRDARGYILPSGQRDFLTATKFVNALIKGGVAVHRATAAFQAGGKSYPAGSYVVKTAQAFRPHVLDMFEPQDHPNDFLYPGGPPIPPYDNAGYTLAYQMGVEFDRVLEGFDGPFEPIQGMARAPAGTIAGAGKGYLLSHATNDAFTAVNRLLKDGEEVHWIQQPFTAGGRSHEAGAFYIAGKPSTRPRLEQLAADLGVGFQATSGKPKGDALRLRPVRLALWDRYGGSMPSGWIRWLFEQQYGFPFEVVFPQQLDAGNLRAQYDVIVLPDGAVPMRDGGGEGFPGEERPGTEAAIPEEFKAQLGSVTVANTVPKLREFLEEGGTIVAIGSSTNLAHHLGLPVQSALTEDGKPLPREKFYIPGSVLRSRVDTSHPLAHGLTENVDVFFDESPAFRLAPDAAAKGVRRIAWYDGAEPLRSGWAWGQKYLEDAASVVEADVGKGKLFLFGPEITFRAQPHGTFKFLFNAIHYGAASGGNGRRTAENGR